VDYAAATAVTRSFTVNKASQTITLPTIPTTTLITGTVTEIATSSSGLPVTVVSTTPTDCTVSGTTITLKTVGTCGLEASQAGNSDYAAAPNVWGHFSITLSTQTITFPAISAKTYGTPVALSATASSGLPVTFTSTTSTVCTVSGTSATLLATGTCTIKATQAGNVDYAAAPAVSQSFTVNKAAQTITLPTIPTTTLATGTVTEVATSSSGLPVTVVSTTPLVCTVSGTTITLKTIGTCGLEASQAGNSDYAVAPNVWGHFSITN
jgi:ribosomal protein S11